MRTRHIEAFHAIYTNGSISSAAEALSVSQPTLSKLLKSAEERLGFAWLSHKAPESAVGRC